MSIKAMQDYTYVSKYARYSREKSRRETWSEAVDRVMDMHLRRFPQLAKEIEFVREAAKQKRVLGSQRALQFGGKPIEDKHARMYNCLDKRTEFITSQGVKSFLDFKNGDETIVLTHTGAWKKAKVKCYGKQTLHKVTIKRGAATHEVWATKNHRWFLSSGETTSDLKVGQTLMFGPNIFSEFDYHQSPPDERLYWAYGYVYGDGTLVKDKEGIYRHSMVRLCGDDLKYRERFEELGFSTSSSLSLDGDYIAFTGKYLKTLPNLEIDDPRLVKAFVRGYMDADATANRNRTGKYGSPSEYQAIQATGKESIDFIQRAFPVAGVYLVSETDKTEEKTNFGFRSDLTLFFRTTNGVGKTAAKFKVESISEEGKEDYVWCLEVEDDQSFVLPFGLVTGNCISAYCDRIRFFQECFWLLLCGCGTGFSVQKHHVAKLPDFFPSVGQKGTKVFTVPDTIEGWADALGVLMATHMPHPEFPEWEGYKVEFDFSQIRPKGSPLASGVGKAPGHEPLQRSLDMIRFLLDDCHGHRSRLRPIDAYDIIMHASDAVLSGGVRRSATLCIFSIDDDEMIKAKTGNWFIENPQRGRSNNSVLLIRNETPKEKFLEIMESVKEFGEPGFIWADDKESLYNPCVTKDTLVTTKDGVFKVGELIGKQFDALVDGDVYRSTEKGFWKTGDKEVFKLTFESGRTLECTANHQILTADGWKEADDLTGEDEIFLHNHQSAESHVVDSQSEDYAKGYLLGSFLADGTTHGDQDAVSIRWWGENKAESKADGFKLMEQAKMLSSYHQVEKLENKSLYSNISSTKLYDFASQQGCLDGKKHLSDKAVTGSWSYLAGLIGGYFDADGTVIFNPEKGSSLRIWSVQLGNLQSLQVALNAFGIQSKIYQDRLKRDTSVLPDGKGGKKEYPIQKAHELVVSRNSIERFHALISLRNAAKAEALDNIVKSRNKTPYRSTFIDRIVSKENVGVKEVYDCTVPEVSAFDANGVYVHNCVEIALYGYDEQGNSGWQACNLCEINGKKLKTREDFEIAAKAGAILGTIQASYTNFAYLGEVSKRIVEREALLGVSITGMMDNPDLIFDPAVQREMAQLVLDVNEEIAAKIGINKAARATCVKPAGTTSCILGTSSGIHPHHAKRYFRRIQGNALEAPLQFFKLANPLAVEKSVWSANGTDEIITFCVEVNSGRTKNDLSALKLLDYVRSTQQNWVAAGKREEACVKPWLMHNVSNTINVRPEEWADVAEYIFENRQFFAGISLLPQSGDLDYPQAPFTTVYTPKEIVSIYGDGSLMASGLIVHGLEAFDNNLWAACDAVLGLGAPIKEDEATKLEFLRRAKQFAKRYFKDDLRQMVYCLKCVHNWKLWCDLNREYRDVDYSQMYEADDATTLQETIACNGGKCCNTLQV